MAEKEVKLKVTTETDISDIEDLQSKLEELKSAKLQLQLQADMKELEEVNGQIEETKSKLDDLKAKVDVDNSKIEELESELEELEDKRLELDVESDSSELEELDSQIEETQSKLESLRASVAVDDNEIQSLEDELSDLESRQIELTGNIEVAGLDETSQGLSDIEQQADATSSALESMAMLDIANTLNQWGSEAEGFAQELDNIAISTEQLAIQTGMTDAEMTGMLNNITNATFPREEALMYVQSLDQIGVSAQNLGASATGLDRINDAFHLGAEKTNRLGQELSVLGVDMNNVSSSFNALAYANANTVGGMDNYFSFLQRYDAQFKELGMNVDQASVAIAAATQKYGGGRAALSGMSEALKNCNGDMSVLEQELGLTAGSLTNASQLTGQYAGQLDAMADAEGRHKTLTQQIAAALDDVTASVNGAISPFASFIGLVGNAGSFAVGINGLWELGSKLKELSIIDGVKGKLNTLKSTLISVGTTMKSAAISAVNLGKAVLTAGYNALKTVAMWVAEKVQVAASALAKVAATIQTYALAVAEWFLASPILIVVAAVVALIAILWYLYNTNDSVKAAIDGLGQALWGLGETIYGYLVGAFEWLQGAWQNTVDFFTTGGQSIWDTLTGVFTGIYDTITGTLGSAFTWLTDSFNLVVSTFQTYAPLVAQALFVMATGGIGAIVLLLANMNGMPNQVGAILQRVISSIISFVSNMVSQFTNGARNAVSNFASGISGLTSAMTGELNRMLGAVGSWISQVISRFYNAGVEFVNALKRGMGIGSPGYMYYMMETELGRIEHIVKDNNIPSNVQKLGTNIVDAFGDNNGLSLNSNGTTITGTSQAGTVNYTFNLYGDIDNEDRMQKFIDALIRELEWDNAVAGRNTNFGA